MKRKVILSALALAMVVGMVAFASQDKTGNGAPSGYHYTLNIIGVNNPKNANMEDLGAGNVIFVPLDNDGEVAHTKIVLNETDGDFAVVDKNGTDGDAEFALPAPGTEAYVIGGDMEGVDTETDYSVFVRPLGKPGGWCTITTCADVLDSTFGDLLPNNVYREILNSDGYFGGYASIEQVGYAITHRDNGKEIFVNVTAQLTTIVFRVWVDLDAGGIVDGVPDIDDGEIFYVRVPIFDTSLQGEYWDYANNGLKVLQVRFYPGVPSDLTDWDAPYMD